MIELNHLTKTFGPKLAVDNLSVTVRPGQVTGFLGPNGAGKSTTMRMIIGLDRPDRGEVRVNGRRYASYTEPLRQVGALLDAKALHPGRSAEDHLRALAATAGIGRDRVREMLELVGLTEVAGKRARTFSLGMTQRLGIAAALLGDPPVIILDEPINGLDPDGIHWIRGLLRSLAGEGRTVFVSSHLMSEMALTADQLIILGRGRLLADVSMSDMIKIGRRVDPGAYSASRTAARSSDRARPSGRGRRIGRDAGQRTEPRSTCRAGVRPPDHPARTHSTPVLTRGRLSRLDPRCGRVLRHVRLQEGRMTTFEHITGDSLTGAGSGSASRLTLLRRAYTAELIKLRSVRSTVWLLGLTALSLIGDGVVNAIGIVVHAAQDPAFDRSTIDPAGGSLSGLGSAWLPVAVLGILAVTGDYSTGMIKTTIAAVPSRSKLVLGKIGALVTVVLPVTLASTMITFVAAETDPRFVGHPDLDPSSRGASGAGGLGPLSQHALGVRGCPRLAGAQHGGCPGHLARTVDRAVVSDHAAAGQACRPHPTLPARGGRHHDQ